MAILFASGFEIGDVSKWTSVVSVTVQNSIKHSGNYAARIQNNGRALAYEAPGATRISFWFYAAALPASEDGWVSVVANKASITRIGCVVNSNGNISVNSTEGSVEGEVFFDDSFSISEGQWYRICITTDNIGADFVNTPKVWVDGRLIAWVTNSYNYLVSNKIGREDADPDGTFDFYYDDIIFDDDSSNNNMDDMCVLRAGITGAGEYAEFDSYVGSANHFENVDELSLNDDDYNYDSINNPAKESYALENSSAIGLITRNVIKAIETLVRMKRGGGGSTIFSFLRRDNGVDIEEPVIGVGTSFNNFLHIDYEMPNGGGRWTQNRFDALEIGVSYNGGARDPYFSHLSVMVIFSPFLFVRSTIAGIGGASADLTFVTEEPPKAAPALVFGASGSGVNSWDF